jgi:hypothetical protein
MSREVASLARLALKTLRSPLRRYLADVGVRRPDISNARLSGRSSCPRCVNCFGMWRVQRMDQINVWDRPICLILSRLR